MAKGQQRSNKEARKPKKAKVKTIAANPSQKMSSRGLENLKNDWRLGAAEARLIQSGIFWVGRNVTIERLVHDGYVTSGNQIVSPNHSGTGLRVGAHLNDD